MERRLPLGEHSDRMEITVKLFGTLRRFSNPGTPGRWRGEVPENIQVQDLFEILGIQEAEVAAAAVNGETCPYHTPVPQGAVVTLVTPVGGG